MAAGTVTFLFTDIEASTRRWEADPVAMSEVLARHDGIVRSAVERAGGEIFKHTGDGVCAVFSTAAEGVAAALAAQRALQAEDWGEAGRLRVRMGLHTGTAERRAGDYFGPTLNRVARLMATAHGGQIVASLATTALNRDRLPAGATLIDLGEHRLADLTQPEHVFQVGHPDLPADFPPLRSLDSHRHNLPISPTPFVGREQELEEVEAVLGGARLVTLIGTGGAGKTRLALETAGRALGSFPDGAFFIELAPLTDPDLVAQAVVSAVGLVLDRVGSGPGAALERLAEHLSARRALLVLDNCEHVVEPAAALADTLLRRCPDVTVLATSREPLAVPGEALWRVPSLSLPLEGAAEPEDVTAADAVALLCDRARAADPSFRLTRDNAPALAQICRRLDGIPLALELAAARFRLMSPAEVAARLDDRFRLLTGGARTLARHRTLSATIDWGYDLLSESERTVLGRLSVFAGGFDLASAESVVPDAREISGGDVLDLLGRLVDRSWVAIEPGAQRTRYRLLETIRQYAGEKLGASGEEDEVCGRHAEHFRRTASLFPGYPLRPPSWLAQVDADEDNMRAALEWSFRAGDVEACLQMTAGLSRFWGLSGRLIEGRAWLERALEAAPGAGSVGTVGALNGMGFLLFQAGEPPAVASSFYERARAMAREVDDPPGEAVACGFLGFRALQRGEFDEAERLTDAATERFLAAGITNGVIWSEWGRGCIASARGDLRGAADRFERVLTLGRGDDESYDVFTHALAALGPLSAVLGDEGRARQFAEEAIDAARQLGIPHVLVMALTRAVETAVRLGDTAQAAQHLVESLRLLRNMEGLSWAAYSLELSALITAGCDRHRAAARLFGAAHALDEISQESSKGRPLNNEMENCVANLQRVLGTEQFAAELAAGGAIGVKEAMTLALGELVND